jgi:UDP-N-acetylglucosamine 3-dehydrogenase
MLNRTLTRVGVVGVGQMGIHHARIYSRMTGADLIGITDTDSQRGSAVASRFGTRYFHDLEDLLNEEPDALSIVVPTSLHREVAEQALDMGVHLLVEKPIADTMENAWAILQKAKEKNCILMVGHIERFNPAIKSLLALGTMGKVELISTLRVAPYPKRISDAGIILDVSCHDIDLISYLTGLKAIKVSADAKQEFHKYEDEAVIRLSYRDGSKAVVETSWHYPYKNRRLFVKLEHGGILLNFMKQALTVFNADGAVTVPVHSAEPLSIELHTFIDTVANDLPSPVNGEDSIYTLSVTSSAVRSYKESKEIKLSTPTHNTTYHVPVLAMI